MNNGLTDTVEPAPAWLPKIGSAWWNVHTGAKYKVCGVHKWFECDGWLVELIDDHCKKATHSLTMFVDNWSPVNNDGGAS